MLEKIRAIVIFRAVMFITVGMTLDPANAATMISCESETPSASDYTQPYAEHHAQVPHGVHDDVESSTPHHAEHCSSHACIFGISVSSYAPSDSLVETRLVRAPFASSLVPLASPEGLRRPPRA